MRRKHALLFAALLLTAGPSDRLAAQDRRIDVTTYRFLIDLPDTGNVISAIATVLFKPLRGYDDTLRLDLVGMTVRRIFDIETIARVPFVHEGGVLKIAAGRAKGVVIEYSGAPSDGLVYRPANARGRRSFFADNWPNRARYWLPTNDTPADKAGVTWSVRAPAGMRVIMNAAQCNRTTRVSRRFGQSLCIESAPIPTYGMVLGATTMRVSRHRPAIVGRDTIPVEVWAYPEDSAWADSVPFRRATEQVEVLSRLVGQFPYARMAHVQSSTRFGGMENPSAIFYSENAMVRRTLGEGTVRHETAHQWFGDAVTAGDWHHVWLSEGFATYFKNVIAEQMDGPAALASGLLADRTSYLASQVVERPIIDTAITDPNRVLNANTYQKAGLVLHMLRRTVGDSAFFRGVREYYRTWRDSSVLSAHFQRHIEQSSRSRLDWFFRQWLWQPGYPQVTVRFAADTVWLRQSQPDAWGTWRIERLPLAIEGAGCRRTSVTLAARREEQAVAVPGCTPSAVVIDPDRDWLVTTGP